MAHQYIETDVEKLRMLGHVITGKNWCLGNKCKLRALLVLAKAVKFEFVVLDARRLAAVPV